MADPEPQVGLPIREYVEIINVSENDQRLSDLEYADAGTTVSLPDEILSPREIVILCKAEDTVDFQFFGRCIGLDTWPALNNSGDVLSISSKNGEIIDEVQYNRNWYQDQVKSEGGWSLERINPFKKCSGQANWKASEESSGGTPGFRNSVYDDLPDTQPPEIEFTEVVSDYQLEIHFDDLLDSLGSETVIQTIPNLDLQWVHTGSQSVKISFVQPFDSGLIHQIYIDSLSDCEGNMAPELNDHFGLGRSPKTWELIITELMADPEPAVGLPETEYFEILNNSDVLISLQDVIIINNKDSSELPGITMQPGSYLVFSSSSGVELFSDKTKALKLSPWPGLNNESDHLEIRYSGNIIFEINYDRDWMNENSKKNGGWSLEMIDPGNPCGEEDNWTGSEHADGGTPGFRNSVWASNPDREGPVLLDYSLPDANHIELYLNEKADLTAISEDVFRINDMKSISGISMNKRFDKSIILQSEDVFRSKTKYVLEIDHLADCISNYSFDHHLEFLLPEVPDSGDLLINEILVDPYSGGSEFVEIVNVSDKTINMKNLQFKTVDDQNQDKSLAYLTSDALLFHPGEILVLSADTSTIAPYYSHSNPDAFFEVSGFPSLTNDEGFVLLLDSSGQMLDSLHYLNQQHFELIHDTKGVSLERISLVKASWDQDNWSSAAETKGFATPGLVNSKRFSSEASQSRLAISPEIFSPDGDGYHDLVSISFNSANAGTMLTLEIYDVSGRIVKNLANNVNTGLSNNFFWDGIDDSGRKCPIGNYILLAEFFDINGDTGRERKIISLGGRL
jgi:hypothetical protein